MRFRKEYNQRVARARMGVDDPDARAPRSSGAPKPMRTSDLGSDVRRFAIREIDRLLEIGYLPGAMVAITIGSAVGAFLGVHVLYATETFGDFGRAFGITSAICGTVIFAVSLVIGSRAATREFRSGMFTDLAVTPTKPEDVAAGKALGALWVAMPLALAAAPGIIAATGMMGLPPIIALASVIGILPSAALGVAFGVGMGIRRLSRWYVAAAMFVLLLYAMFPLAAIASVHLTAKSQWSAMGLWFVYAILGHPAAAAASSALGAWQWLASLAWCLGVAYMFANAAANAVTSEDIAEEIASSQPMRSMGRDRPWFVPARLGYQRPRIIFEEPNPMLTYERAFGWIPMWGFWHTLAIAVIVVLFGAFAATRAQAGSTASALLTLALTPLLLIAAVISVFSMAWGLRRQFDTGVWEETQLTLLTRMQHLESVLRPSLDNASSAVMLSILVVIGMASFGEITLLAAICILIIVIAEPVGRAMFVALSYPREGAASAPTLYTVALTLPFYLLSTLASPHWPTRWLSILSPPGAIYLGTRPAQGFSDGMIILIAAALVQVAFAGISTMIVLRRRH